jgi:hypothetical protein
VLKTKRGFHENLKKILNNFELHTKYNNRVLKIMQDLSKTNEDKKMKKSMRNMSDVSCAGTRGLPFPSATLLSSEHQAGLGNSFGKVEQIKTARVSK